ncbi:MAG: methyl-accepting chemotaxis protein, partial [Bacteroidales bacterium]|nr:methyl-accepting chemotaxis protein [Candidatus Scybalousia scybalohippi]
MADNTDKLELKVVADVKDAKKELNDFANSVGTLSDKLSSLDSESLSKLTSNIKPLNRKGNLSNFEQSIDNITNGIQRLVSNLSSIDTTKFDKVTKLVDDVSKISSKSIDKATKSAKKMNDSLADETGIKKKFDNVDQFYESIKGLGKDRTFYGNQKALETEIERVRNRIEKSKDAIADYENRGTTLGTKGWESEQRRLERLSNYLDNLITKRDSYNSKETKVEIPRFDNTKPFQGIDYGDYNKFFTETGQKNNLFNYLSNDAKELASRIEETSSKLAGLTAFDSKPSVVRSMNEEIQQLVNEFNDIVDYSEVSAKAIDSSSNESASAIQRVTSTASQLGEQLSRINSYGYMNKITYSAREIVPTFRNAEESTSRFSQVFASKFPWMAQNIENAKSRINDFSNAFSSSFPWMAQNIDNITNRFKNLSNNTNTSISIKPIWDLSSLNNPLPEGGKGTKTNPQQYYFEPTVLGKNEVFTSQYKDLEKELLSVQQKFESLLNKKEKFESLGRNTNSVAYKQIIYDLSLVDGKYKQLLEDMRKLQESGNATRNLSFAEQFGQGAKDMSGILSSVQKGLSLGGFGKAATSVQRLSSFLDMLSKGLEKATEGAATTTGALSGISSAIPYIGVLVASLGTVASIGLKVGKVLWDASKKAVNGLKQLVVTAGNVVKAILSIGTGSYQATTVFGKLWNKIVNTFKSRVLRQAVTKAIEGVKAGFESLDAYSEKIGSPYHSNISTLVADFKLLGRTIAAAFEPIINVVSPILDFLINKLIDVINAINQFMAAITMSDTWTKATKTTSDYESAASGASKAQKDLNKQIREWDKLNVITDPNKNSGGGGGGSKSGADGTGFETVKTDNSFAKKLKNAWNTENWSFFEGLGKKIGDKLRDELNSIPWDSIKENAKKVGSALASILNGFTESNGLDYSIGNTIAQAINTGLNLAYGFIDKAKASQYGEFIGNIIKTSINNIEWDTYLVGMSALGSKIASFVNGLASSDVLTSIARSIANLLKGAVNLAWSFVGNLDFEELGLKISKAINNFINEMNKVDDTGLNGWQKMAQTIGKTIKGIEDLLSTAIDNIDFKEVEKAVTSFLLKLDWNGIFTSSTELIAKVSKALLSLLTIAAKTVGILSIQIGFNIVTSILELTQKIQSFIVGIGIKTIALGLSILTTAQEIYDTYIAPIIEKAKSWVIGITANIVGADKL